jgi:hypothetical protein
MVKIAECKCNDCPKEFNLFKIEFKKKVPPWHIMCPVCLVKKLLFIGLIKTIMNFE